MVAEETKQETFDRGVEAGEVRSQLKQHGDHLAKINGSMDRVGDKLSQLVLAVQSLEEGVQADLKTRIATAEALKLADDQRRSEADRRWTPTARIITVILAITAVAGAYIGFIQ